MFIFSLDKEYFTFVYFVWMAINLTKKYHLMLSQSLDILIEMSQNSETWNQSCMKFVQV